MAKRDQTSILVRMPKTLKRRLAREVARQESTLNDVAVAALADEFGVAFTPSGRRGQVPGETGVVLLRIPPQLKRQLAAAAARFPATRASSSSASRHSSSGSSPPQRASAVAARTPSSSSR